MLRIVSNSYAIKCSSFIYRYHLKRERCNRGESMDFFDTMQIPYKTVIKEEWKNLNQELIDKTRIVFPMTTSGDTALHLAVYSGEEEPTRALLAAMSEMDEVFWRNGAKNTPLHEAAAVGNLAAVKLLVEYNKTDLLAMNIYGETPLFRAARFGHLHIVEYFLEDCEDFFSRSPINWTTGKQMPIIHAAIQSEKFEVVLKLVDFENSLLEMKDEAGNTALHVLANMPLAFQSGSSMKYLDSIIYALLPSEDVYEHNFTNFESFNKDDSEIQNSTTLKNQELEAQCRPNPPLNFCHSNCWKYLRLWLWRFVLLAWPQWKELYLKKRKHKLALTIAQMLARIDYSWRQTKDTPENIEVDATGVHFRRIEDETIEILSLDGHIPENTDIEYDDHYETPLLLAAARGIVEIVEKIVEAHPQAVDYVTMQQRNLLHVAIAHRQSKIFDWIQNRRLIMARLVTRIDNLGFTALHHVGIMKFYRRGTYGPALQLQQELKWFQRVQDQIPALYNQHHSRMRSTALELFEKTHSGMLEDGKEWLKKTSESCSAVAVLIAAIVFAAAYTVPGGLNSKTGSPVLVREPIYMMFTVMDIVALATSLTSVVLFLSILMSPFMMEDFLETLPLKLSFGYLLLFFSVASTMMAFALTVVLTVKSSEMKGTVSLLYMATFFPVTMFITIQLPLYVELLKNIWSYRRNLFKFLPTGLVVALFWRLPSKFVRKILRGRR